MSIQTAETLISIRATILVRGLSSRLLSVHSYTIYLRQPQARERLWPTGASDKKPGRPRILLCLRPSFVDETIAAACEVLFCKVPFEQPSHRQRPQKLFRSRTKTTRLLARLESSLLRRPHPIALWALPRQALIFKLDLEPGCVSSQAGCAYCSESYLGIKDIKDPPSSIEVFSSALSSIFRSLLPPPTPTPTQLNSIQFDL